VRVIEGEAPTSEGERPTKGPMICGGEFSGEILLLLFHASLFRDLTEEFMVVETKCGGASCR
jgi:hypothetical protein